MSHNILIVEDESIIAMEIENYLKSLGYNIVDICTTGADAYKKAMSKDIDLILMDVCLIGSDGIDTALKIKREKDIPIMFLTAHMDEKTIERAISVEPIAYLTKPFNRKELFAAVKIGLSKYSILENSLVGEMILDYQFSFNSKSSQLICCSEEVHLSKKERQLLELFLNRKNSLLTFMDMEYELWADKPSSDSRRRTLISRLRTKLKHRFIETYASEGYIFKV